MGIIDKVKAYAQERYKHETHKRKVYTQVRNKAEIKYTKQKAEMDAKKRVLGEPKKKLGVQRKESTGLGGSFFMSGGGSSRPIDPMVANFYGGGTSGSQVQKKKKQENLRYGWM